MGWGRGWRGIGGGFEAGQRGLNGPGRRERAEKARQPLPWDMRVLAEKGLVEMPLPRKYGIHTFIASIGYRETLAWSTN